MDINGTDFLVKIKHLSKVLELKACKDYESIGITSQQARILFYIIKSNESGLNIKQKDIEERYQLSKSTVSGLVKRLEERGFVKRDKNTADVFLIPTEKSIEIKEHMIANKNKIHSQLLNCLTKGEQKKLEKTIDKIIKKVEEEDALCGTK